MMESPILSKKKPETIKEVTAENIEDSNPTDPDVKTTLDHYKVGKVLGKGAYGKVHLSLHKLANRFVAMKSMSK